MSVRFYLHRANQTLYEIKTLRYRIISCNVFNARFTFSLGGKDVEKMVS